MKTANEVLREIRRLQLRAESQNLEIVMLRIPENLLRILRGMAHIPAKEPDKILGLPFRVSKNHPNLWCETTQKGSNR